MREVNLLPDSVMAYMNNDFETLKLQEYFDPQNLCDKPLPVELYAPCLDGMPDAVTVYFGLNEDLSDAQEFRLQSGQKSVTVRNLFAGTEYFCKYVCPDGREYRESFITVPQAPRFIDVDGLRNVRDFGGWRAEGGRLRQGLIYRGSEMNLIADHGIQITPSGIDTMKNCLGIRSDLDLRSPSESGGITHSPLGKDVIYFRQPILGYMDMFKEEYIPALKEIFTFLARRENYPVYLHCWAGADRTGTLIALLKAALGVSYEDITRDLELSTFSMFGVRGRSNREFTYEEFFAHLKERHPSQSLQGSARSYLLDKVGVNRNDLLSIGQILIDIGGETR